MLNKNMKNTYLIICFIITVFMLNGCKSAGSDKQDTNISILENSVNDLTQSNSTLTNIIDEKEKQLEELNQQLVSQTHTINSLNLALKNADEEISELKDSLADTNALNNPSDVSINFNNIMFISGGDNQINYIQVEDTYNSVQWINIIGDFIEHTELQDFKIREFSVGKEGILRINVLGYLYQMRIMNYQYNPDAAAFFVGEEIMSLGNVHNEILLIEADFPEGMPYLYIEWEDATGFVQGFPIHYDGYGFLGEVVMSH